MKKNMERHMDIEMRQDERAFGESKEELRTMMRRRRAALGENERRRADTKIRETLRLILGEEDFEWILFYVSYGTEVDTTLLLREMLRAVAAGQSSGNGAVKIAVPAVVPDGMQFYQITDFSELSPGFRGILEPKIQSPAVIQNAVMLMPGLVFDRNLHRIGYGGGYYDRYLASYPEAVFKRIALAYDFQVITTPLPVEEYDICPDLILTEKGIYENTISSQTEHNLLKNRTQ